MAAVRGAVGGGCCGHPGLLPRCAVPVEGAAACWTAAPPGRVGGLAGPGTGCGMASQDGVLADLVEALAVESLPDSARDTLTALYAWRGTGIISTMRSTKTWACRWGVEWSRVRVNSSSNNLQGSGMRWSEDGFNHRYHLRLAWKDARLRRCFRYSSNHPPTHNYAR